MSLSRRAALFGPLFVRIIAGILMVSMFGVAERAEAASNAEARVAFDVRAPVAGRNCAGLAGAFPACSSIQPALIPVGSFSAVIVLYNFTAIRGASYTI